VDTFFQVLCHVLIRTIEEPIGDWKKPKSQFGIRCCWFETNEKMHIDMLGDVILK
jgi:hypothetical protein